VTEPSPDRPPLDRDRLTRPGAVEGMVVEVLEETASTNALATERARAGTPAGLVVVAEHQTAGRGRLDRRWVAPPRSALTFSVLLRPSRPVGAWPWLPLLAGYAVATALRAAGHPAGVKWPNDVLLGELGAERKVAGILAERVETPSGPAAVVGIGLNVAMTAAELPVPEATSIAIESGVDPDRTDLLLSLLRTLRETYDAWQSGDERADELAESYRSACVTVGREVRVALPAGGDLSGRATGIDAGGRLVVAGPDGEQAVGAGDVVHVRDAPSVT
jgi:BirA family transcriptional regulator, biotin operon repressor / biotin---[acetyl-CoA-carboxylase] ligase